MSILNRDILESLMLNIPKGKHNAIHQKELSEKLGVKPAKVKRMVQEARQRGLLDILSGKEGYWIADNDQERKAFETMLRKQAITRLKTTKPIRDNLKSYKGQISLSDTLETDSNNSNSADTLNGDAEEVDGDGEE